MHKHTHTPHSRIHDLMEEHEVKITELKEQLHLVEQQKMVCQLLYVTGGEMFGTGQKVGPTQVNEGLGRSEGNLTEMVLDEALLLLFQRSFDPPSMLISPLSPVDRNTWPSWRRCR